MAFLFQNPKSPYWQAGWKDENGKRVNRSTKVLAKHSLRKKAQKIADAFRLRLGLPHGRIGAIAGIHTFGDYLINHPHLHVLAADGLFTPDGRFHCMPAED